MTANNTTQQTAAVCPSYYELKQLLTQLVDNGPADRVLPMSLQILSHPSLLAGLLSHVVNDADWFSRVQQASYYHRNGFDKLVLMEGLNFKLRLHHFRPGATVLPSENIHDHRWPFASSVIGGRLRMRIYEASPVGGIPVHEYRYHSDKSNGSYHCDSVGACGLVQTDYIIYEAGTHYFMPTTTLHQIVYQPGEEALTLVLTGKPERTTCRLYAKGILKDEEMEIEPYATPQLEKKLSNIVEQINSKYLNSKWETKFSIYDL